MSTAVAKPVRRIAKPATRTTIAKVGQVDQRWFIVDATDKILGRLASEVATILMGKHKPTYTPHVDTGGFVIITKATKIKYTGRKGEQRQYEYYTYYAGGKGTINLKDFLAKNPGKVFEMAVRRMLPKT